MRIVHHGHGSLYETSGPGSGRYNLVASSNQWIRTSLPSRAWANSCCGIGRGAREGSNAVGTVARSVRASPRSPHSCARVAQRDEALQNRNSTRFCFSFCPLTYFIAFSPSHLSLRQGFRAQLGVSSRPRSSLDERRGKQARPPFVFGRRSQAPAPCGALVLNASCALCRCRRFATKQQTGTSAV